MSAFFGKRIIDIQAPFFIIHNSGVFEVLKMMGNQTLGKF